MEIEGVKLRKKYYFIDETGDTSFFDKLGHPLEGTNGYQPYFIMGILETNNRKYLRDAVLNFKDWIRRDILYSGIPSIAENEDWFVHARKDHPEVRINFIELLRKIRGFKIHVIIVKKGLKVFKEKYNGKASAFYLDVLRRLLHQKNFDKRNYHSIHLSQYGKNQLAILKEVVRPFEECGVHFRLNIAASNKMSELSIVDYMLWMFQRKLLKGESRFFEALRGKFGVIVEL
ncbi:DUF3800 domain-containing protein [Chitinophaga rhizosphaerae]|uniref:DUF3800 domain-containing protein n=1 Tax=Chitinophaga rhizosphaerae TaxID=1864947 RepID=UPI000F80093B|nr:DUF3800 domain-containing protein [Chitinophaga rhizosphaerae]